MSLRPLLPLSMLRVILGCLFFSLLAGCASRAEGTATPSSLPPPVSQSYEYLVGEGDVLRINVAGHPELSSALYRQSTPGTPVDGSGEIQLPYLGSIPAAGKTVFEIKEDLETRLRKYLKHPTVDVAVVEFLSHRVYVFGEVRKPGMFPLDRPLTILQALSMTGGFTDAANRTQVALVRGPVTPENVMLLDTEDLTAHGDVVLAPGDLLFVPRRRWASVGAVALDIVPFLELISLPIGTARDVALFQDIRRR